MVPLRVIIRGETQSVMVTRVPEKPGDRVEVRERVDSLDGGLRYRMRRYVLVEILGTGDGLRYKLSEG